MELNYLETHTELYNFKKDVSLLTYKLPNNINKSFKVLYNYLEKLEPIKIKIFNSSTIKRYFT